MGGSTGKKVLTGLTGGGSNLSEGLINRTVGLDSSAGKFLDPAGTMRRNREQGGATTGETVLDPGGFFKKKPNTAAEEAAQLEAERKARIQSTVGQINSIYDAPSRQKQYSDFINAVRQQYIGDANRQKIKADLGLKFANARSGLTGGSHAVDSQRTLGDEFTRGILTAENKAQAALGDLKAQDEASRLQLIQLAQAGLDSTTAAARAGANMQSGLQSSQAGATAKGLGDIFGETAAMYKRQEEAAARRAGQNAPIGSPYGSAYGRY